MDKVKQKLKKLSRKYKIAKKKFFKHSDHLISTFNLTDKHLSAVSFGMSTTANPKLQKFVDILNSDKTLIKLHDKVSGYKNIGVIAILKYALKCNEKISGYDIQVLLENPSDNQDEINNLFEGFAGVQHIHLINGKIMLEMPARESIRKNKKLLKYVDFWSESLELIIDE